MADKSCVKRLQKEYRALCKEPVSHVVARPSPNDILEWHYVLEGSEGTPFAGGYYYGKIKFPPEYPFKPPGITMTTPNGRFITQKKICLSMSDFHPESWNPMWSVSSILTGLLSFMMDNSPTTGSVSSTVAERQRFAKASLAFNCKNQMFKKIFPEYVEKYNSQKQLEQKSGSSTENPPSKEEPALLHQRIGGDVIEQDENDGEVVNAKKNRMQSKNFPQQKSGSSTENPPSKEEPALLHQRIGGDAIKQDENDGEVVNDKNNRKQSKSFPLWLLLLLGSVFGLVMALPLIQL